MRFLLVCPVVLALGAAGFVACGSSNTAAGPTGPDASSPSDAGSPDSAPTPIDDASAGDDYWLPTPAAWDTPVTRPDDDASAAGRASCAFARGDMPAKTLGASTPVDTDIPIENVVVVMMENRSFDSMFGHLNEFAGRADVQEPPANASNPLQAANWDSGVPLAPADAGADAAAPAAPWTHAPYECFADTDHSWRAQHWSWDNGLNDGFFAQNNGATDPGDIVYDAGSLLDGRRAMWWYDQTDIPFDYKLASSFAIADNYFCSLLGPTGPNRMYLVAGTSLGLVDNSIPNGVSQNIVDDVVIPDELQQRHVTWATYSDGIPSLAVVLSIGIATRYPQPVRFAFQRFLDDAKAGKLPQVSWVDPNVGANDGMVTNNDDHPPSDIQIGSTFLSQVYQAVTTSPQWAHTALFITWDENGGEYDHLPPSPACAPDTNAPILSGGDVGTAGDFTRYGFRVPLIVVSPYAKKAFASHNVYDHTSIARFIETKFKIPALTARDANADPLMDLFDFKNAPAFATPPVIPAPEVNDAGLQLCTQMFGQ